MSLLMGEASETKDTWLRLNDVNDGHASGASLCSRIQTACDAQIYRLGCVPRVDVTTVYF
jgi:hypothetical protein